MFILEALPLALGIILFKTIPLFTVMFSTKRSLGSIKELLEEALETAESTNFLSGKDALLGKVSSNKRASATLLPFMSSATRRTLRGTVCNF